MTVEVVSACYLNVLMLVIQQHDLDTDGLNVATSLQTNVMWFGTMLLTPGCGCVLVVTSITKIPSSLTVLVRFLFSRVSAPSFHTLSDRLIY